TVALGGDGGDELFAGYQMYRGHAWAAVYTKLPRFLRAGLIEPMGRLLPVKTKNLSFDYKALRFVTGTKYDLVTRHHVWFGSFTPEEQQQLLTKEAIAETDQDIYRQAREMMNECGQDDVVKSMQDLDT